MVKTVEEINLEFMSEWTQRGTESVISAESIVKRAPILYTAPESAGAGIQSDIQSPNESPDAPADFPALPKSIRRTKIGGVMRLALDVVFYASIVFVFFSAIVFYGESNNGFHLLGYSWFTVLSDSMETEIPTGSLIITKKMNPGDIQIGDDITYIRGDNAAITHRVVGIEENYMGSRGFITQGTENLTPDSGIVHAANVVGVVKLSIPELGFTLSYIAHNIGTVFLILGGVFVAVIFIRKFISETRKAKRKP